MAEKISANRGDLFEVFFASAVAARFVKRAETRSAKKLPPINSSELEEVLSQVMTNGYKKNVNDVGSAVIDTVTVNISVPKKAFEFLSDKTNWKKVSDLRDGAIRFANTHSRLNVQARGLSINERQDLIKIAAAGTEDQKGTKADVKIEVTTTDGKRKFKNIDYSLKVTGGEQFHQVSGQGFDKFLNIFGEMGLDVSPIQSEYENLINSFFDAEVYTKKYSSRDAAKASGGGEQLKKAARLVYKYAATSLNESLNAETSNQTKVKFADYIIYGLSRNVNTELVKFVNANTVKTRVANRQFRDLLVSNRYHVEINSSGDPKISIYLAKSDGTKMAGSSNLLMQIRYKMEVASSTTTSGKVYRFYPRNYLEAQPGMFLI